MWESLDSRTFLAKKKSAFSTILHIPGDFRCAAVPAAVSCLAQNIVASAIKFQYHQNACGSSFSLLFVFPCEIAHFSPPGQKNHRKNGKASIDFWSISAPDFAISSKRSSIGERNPDNRSARVQNPDQGKYGLRIRLAEFQSARQKYGRY
ncbi:MAG: hypothetical protein FWD77_05340 [Betaproteobacteria bacterium]|nr:hypothetical protein [Betaproteobacteria bacterium]